MKIQLILVTKSTQTDAMLIQVLQYLKHQET